MKKKVLASNKFEINKAQHLIGLFNGINPLTLNLSESEEKLS